MSDIDIIIASQSVELEADGTVVSYVGTITDTDDWRTAWTFELLYYLDAYTATGNLEILIDGTNATVNGGTFATITLDGTQSLTFRGDGIVYTLGGDMTENGETLAAGTYTVVALWGNDSVSISVALVNESGTLALTDPDATAPTFSNVSVSDVTGTTANFNAQINEAGTIFWAVFPTATAQQTDTVIEAGTGAVDFGSISTAGSTIETDGITGLDDMTAYKVHYFGRDTAGNESTATLTSEFSTSDATAPTLTAASIENATASQLDLTFDEATTITTAGWSMSASGGAVTIDSVVSGSGTTTPKLGLSRSIATGETVTISYDTATGNTTDANSNELAAITDQAVTNNVASSFHPNDLSPDYFDETERNLDGATGINTGLYSAFGRNDFYDIYCKISFSDGRLGATQTFIGGRSGVVAARFQFFIDATGKLGGIVSTTAPLSSNQLDDGAVSNAVIRISKTTSTINGYINGVEWFSAASAIPNDQVSQTIYYGCNNNNGTLAGFVIGTGKMCFMKAGASEMASDDRSNLESYIAAL